MIRLVVFDIDGTLVHVEEATSAFVQQQIKALAETGVGLGFASGRSFEYIMGYARGVGVKNPVIIGENGMVLNDDKDFYRKTLGKRPAAMTRIKRMVGERFSTDEVFMQRDRVALAIHSKTPEINVEVTAFVRPLVNEEEMTSYFHPEGFIDIVPKGHSKGHALGHYMAATGLSPSEVVACGDSLNDLSFKPYVDHLILLGDKYHVEGAVHAKDQAEMFAMVKALL